MSNKDTGWKRNNGGKRQTRNLAIGGQIRYLTEHRKKQQRSRGFGFQTSNRFGLGLPESFNSCDFP